MTYILFYDCNMTAIWPNLFYIWPNLFYIWPIFYFMTATWLQYDLIYFIYDLWPILVRPNLFYIWPNLFYIWPKTWVTPAICWANFSRFRPVAICFHFECCIKQAVAILYLRIESLLQGTRITTNIDSVDYCWLIFDSVDYC